MSCMRQATRKCAQSLGLWLRAVHDRGECRALRARPAWCVPGCGRARRSWRCTRRDTGGSIERFSDLSMGRAKRAAKVGRERRPRASAVRSATVITSVFLLGAHRCGGREPRGVSFDHLAGARGVRLGSSFRARVRFSRRRQSSNLAARRTGWPAASTSRRRIPAS